MKTRFLITALLATLLSASPASFGAADSYVTNDVHVHLTNYIQEGTDIRKYLEVMGNRVRRSALFGIPLQQMWSYRVSGDNAPKYYLQSDSPLYYYSFTDAWIAMAYKSLPKEQQERFVPMITGFNPADMYAADHIRRVLKTFPGVFSGIGEFSIHKEFVTAKVAGETPSLTDPALDRILDFAGQVGLVALIHNDIDTPFPKEGAEPAYLEQMRALLKRHPSTTIIWAHMGVGRVVRPIKNHIAALEAILKDPAFKHVHFDISWDETAKYVVSSPEATKLVADMINRYPDRFLFGSDEVAPLEQKGLLKVFFQYGPLWNLLSKEASEKVRFGNFDRLFDTASRKVREWEKKELSKSEG